MDLLLASRVGEDAVEEVEKDRFQLERVARAAELFIAKGFIQLGGRGGLAAVSRVAREEQDAVGEQDLVAFAVEEVKIDGIGV